MDTLTSVLEAKSLEELQTQVVEGTSNLIEPTAEEIELILAALAQGKSYKEIKKTIRRVVTEDGEQVSAQGFSLDQIEQIDAARLAKIAELSEAV